MTDDALDRYVHDLKRLHAMMLAGRGDGAEADALAEAMDDEWLSLSEAEQERANAAAAALNEAAGLCP